MKLLYLTRKYAPGIGGMQAVNTHLAHALGAHMQVQLVHGECSNAPQLAWFYCKAILVALTRYRNSECIFLGDGALAPLGYALGKYLRVPVIGWVHGLDVIYPSWLYQHCVARFLPKLDRVIAVSHATQQACQSRGCSAVVIPNGVALPPPPSDAARIEARAVLSQRFGVDLKDRKLVLSLGRLIPRKGIEEFIGDILPSVVAEFGDAFFIIAGNGPRRVAIEALLKPHGASVGFLPEVDEAMKTTLYRAADVFVLPNLHKQGDIEGFGITALEAGAHGLASIAYAVDGLKDAVQEKPILVPEGDAAAFASAITSALHAGSSEAQRMSIHTHIATHYCWENIAARFAEQILSLTKNRGIIARP